MKTFNFDKPMTAKDLNESLQKQFNVKINFEKYSRDQLEDYRNLLRTKVHQIESQANFNDLLTNETYQRDKFVLGVLNTKIKEMLGEAKLAEPAFSKSQQQAAGIALAAKRAGKKPKAGTASASMAKMPTKELEKFASTKHKGLPKHKKTDEELEMNEGRKSAKKPDFLDLDKDGNKKEPMKKAAKDAKIKEAAKPDYIDLDKDGNKKETMKKAAADKKKKAVKEAKMSAGDRAHHHALEYSRHHKEGNLEMALHHRDACEECGGMIQHGPDGKKWHMHAGRNKGLPYPIDEGMLGTAAGAGIGAAVGGPVGAAIGGVAGNALTQEGRRAFKHRNSMIAESIARLLLEDEEGKAKAITSAMDMVSDFTSWMQRVGNYQTKTMIETSDSIRANFGAQEAETFKASVTPALESALAALTTSREQINQAVAVLAGEAPAQETMGQAPDMGGDMNGSMGGDFNAPVPSEDEFAASDAASGGMETAGRMKRESIERGNRLMKILGA